MTSEIDRLAIKLDALVSRDPTRRIFGSDGHRYAREPVDERELATLETAVGFALPDAYRHWTAAAAFSPADPPGILEPPPFLAWLEAWLDRSLARLDEGEARL